jgi:phage-related baseplate assembly protein
MADLLQNLPDPDIIETISYETILAALMADAQNRFDAAGIDYDVGNLETDPVKVVLEAAAFREVILRARINDAAKANLVLFATGSDLDHLAGFYDVVRLEGETDAALRSRTILAIQARSPGGSKYWYAVAARRADVRIRDVSVYREDFLPIIHVAVLSSENNGIPDQAMIDAVTAEVTSDEVRLINDKEIVVEAAVSQVVDISANVWLLPDAPSSVFAQLEQTLRSAWAAEAGIGFDLDISWLNARLHAFGVKRVEVAQPQASIAVPPSQAIALGTVTLVNMGRAY